MSETLQQQYTRKYGEHRARLIDRAFQEVGRLQELHRLSGCECCGSLENLVAARRYLEDAS
jgi:hypothetical protein